jgi:hypothetical protein
MLGICIWTATRFGFGVGLGVGDADGLGELKDGPRLAEGDASGLSDGSTMGGRLSTALG